MITPIGAGIVVFAIMACLFFPGRLLQAIVFFSSFSATAVVNFSNYGMAPAVVFLPVYLAWKFLSGDAIRPVRVSRDFLCIYLLLISFATVSLLTLLINGALHDIETIQVTQTAYVLFGLLVTQVLAIDFAQQDRLEAAIRALRAAAIFIALWGLMQAGCYYTDIPYPSLLNNSSSHFAYMFDQRIGDEGIRIASVATEPSVLAVSLMIFVSFGATLLTVEPRFRNRSWILPVGLAVLVLIASTSTTAYFGFLLLLLVLGTHRPGLTLGVGAATVLVVALIFASFPFAGDMLYQFTIAKTNSSSYADRSGSTLEALGAFGQRPLFGWGWGGSFSYSIVTQLLASTGAIGTACFAAAALGTIVASRAARNASAHLPDTTTSRWRLRAYAHGSENAMIVFFAQSIVTGFHFVVADFWCLWALAIAIPSCLACGLGRTWTASPPLQFAKSARNP